MHTAIIIPARFHSTRLPGKPLIKIANRTMLSRVVDIAKIATRQLDNAGIVIATDDERISAHANTLGIEAIMTPTNCISGTDRALAAAKQLKTCPDYVINLQGDAPFTPPDFIKAVIETLHRHPEAAIATPVVQLSWEMLDQLRHYKQKTPFSGTTAIINQHNTALWFSKQILPAIRRETQLRQLKKHSPVYRHIGLYGYTYAALNQYTSLPEGHYEALEGLEQLRAIENGLLIKTVTVSYQGRPEMTGIDTLEDVKRAEQLLAEYGEIL